jgi:parvulin-like peptidyl-prolyl isomerase
VRTLWLMIAFSGSLLTQIGVGKATAEDAESHVAALVGEVPIRASDVNRAVQTVLQGKEVPPQAVAVLQAQALEQLVGRKQIEQRMAREQELAADFEIAQAFEAMQEKLKLQGVTMEVLYKQRGLTEADVKAELLWELSWKKYLEKHVTDAALEEFFKSEPREFDGTKLGVSHILLRPLNSSTDAMGEVIKQAQELHAQLIARKMTFGEAAKAYSAGPSREQEGDLGFIPRHGVMDEAFSKAAFDLQVGEISQPVRTRFGIHLIRVTKVQPGNKKWSDVREQLLQPVAQQLFLKLAQEEREKTPVRYTGAVPYIRPGTQQVVLPGGM